MAAGGVGGAALGGLLGSVVPVIGTAVGAAIGGAFGLLYGGIMELTKSLNKAAVSIGIRYRDQLGLGEPSYAGRSAIFRSHEYNRIQQGYSKYYTMDGEGFIQPTPDRYKRLTGLDYDEETHTPGTPFDVIMHERSLIKGKKREEFIQDYLTTARDWNEKADQFYQESGKPGGEKVNWFSTILAIKGLHSNQWGGVIDYN